MKWEYDLFEYNGIKKAGLEGWEAYAVVSISQSSNAVLYYCKRPITSKE